MMRRCKDDSGVSNVVSLIMIASILISLLGMIFTTYVPAWAKDTEVQTLNGAMDSYMDLKTGMDTLAIAGDPGTSVTTKITLGSSGGPVFGFGRMTGSIQLVTDSGVTEVSDDTGLIYGQGRGELVYSSSPSRVEDERIVMQAGGIIRDQAGYALMKGPPNILIWRDSATGDHLMSILTYTVEGAEESYSGTGSYMIKTALTSSQDLSYDIAAGLVISLSIETPVEFTGLWVNYLTSMARDAGLATPGDFTVGPGTNSLADTCIVLALNDLEQLEVRTVAYQLSVN